MLRAPERTRDEILTDFRSHDPDIRRYAVRDLCVSSLPDRTSLLESFLAAETDIQLKYEIRKAINEIQSLRAFPARKLDSENLRNLDRAFQSSNADTVNKAFLYAVKHSLEEFLPEMLVIETYSADPFHKMCCIRLMLSAGDRYFQDILDYLENEEPRVLSTAIEALEMIGNTQALASIAQFANHNHNRVRATAIKALHNLGDQRAFALFTRMVQSPHSAYRDSAAYALGRIRIEAGAQLLAILLMDEVESVRAKALEGLEHMGSEGVGRAREILENIEKQNPFGLWPDKLYFKFQGLLDSRPGTPAAMNSDVQAFRMEAVQQMVTKGDEDSIEIVLQRLKIEKDYKVIAALITSLGRVPAASNRKVPILEKYLRHHNDRVRANAVESLASILPGNQRQLLFPSLDDTSNRVVGNTIIALWKSFKKKTEKALKRLVDSPHKLNNLTAVYCIGELADFRLHELAEELLHCRHSEVREKTMNMVRILSRDVPAYKSVYEKFRAEREDFVV